MLIQHKVTLPVFGCVSGSTRKERNFKKLQKEKEEERKKKKIKKEK